MRIFSKPVYEHNGYPWIGVVTLGRDSEVKETAKGKFWCGFGIVEKPPKTQFNDPGGTMNMNAGYDLADKCANWEKGTRLLVCGHLVKDDFWSSRNKTTVYKLIVEFIAEQLDYATMYHNQSSATKYETDTVAEDADGVSGEDYVPDF